MAAGAALLSCLMLAALPARAAGGPPAPSDDYRLPNGLHVVLAPDPEAGSVAVRLRYDVGSRDEPGRLNGLAHLVEHLMFMGSKHVGRGDFMRWLDAAGATGINGSTTFDATDYYETVPPEGLALALWLESDRMGFFLDRLDDAAVTSELTVVENEYTTRVSDKTLGALPLILYRHLFPDYHPYHRLPVGRYEDMERIKLADVAAFFGTWYGPANATLVLAGKLDRDKTKTLIETYFSALPPRAPPLRLALPEHRLHGETDVYLAAKAQDHLTLAWMTPPLRAPGDAALDLTANLLTARLTERLKNGYAQSVSARQSSKRLASVFQLDIVVDKDRFAEEVLPLVDDELGRLGREGPTLEELAGAHAAWSSVELFQLETAHGRAAHLASDAEGAGIAKTYDWFRADRVAANAEAVRDAVRRWLPTTDRVVVIARPFPGATMAGFERSTSWKAK